MALGFALKNAPIMLALANLGLTYFKGLVESCAHVSIVDFIMASRCKSLKPFAFDLSFDF